MRNTSFPLTLPPLSSYGGPNEMQMSNAVVSQSQRTSCSYSSPLLTTPDQHCDGFQFIGTMQQSPYSTTQNRSWPSPSSHHSGSEDDGLASNSGGHDISGNYGGNWQRPGSGSRKQNSGFEKADHHQLDHKLDSLHETVSAKRKRMTSSSTQQLIGDQLSNINGGRAKGHQQRKPVVRKSQRLGDRVTALQQLVCPFGKTDTASVLQETTVVIRNLHDHIQVLCKPYFQSWPLPTIKQEISEVEKRQQNELRSRGLCLVPFSNLTALVGNEAAGTFRVNGTLGRSVSSTASAPQQYY